MKTARAKLTARVKAAAASIPGTTCYGHAGTEIIFSDKAALIVHQGVDGQTVGDIADNVDALLGAGAFAQLRATGTFMTSDETTLDEPSQLYSLSVDPALMATLDAARLVADPVDVTVPTNEVERVADAIDTLPLHILNEGETQVVDIDAPKFEGATVEPDGTVLVTDVRLTYAGEARYEALPLAVPGDAVAQLAADGIAYGRMRREGDRYVLISTETWQPATKLDEAPVFTEDTVFSGGTQPEAADTGGTATVSDAPEGDQVEIDLSAADVTFSTTRNGDASAKIVCPGLRTTMAFGVVAEALRGRARVSCILKAGRGTDKIVAVHGDGDALIYELPRAA